MKSKKYITIAVAVVVIIIAAIMIRAVFLYLGKKGGTTPPGPDEKSGPFFHAQNQEVNVYAR